ncbi:ketopantoate reductase family protein [Halobacillus massiliensis]|uniref:ketopantoate reductase family protein n=1 Tax=Halobacillus massiliensis TaxID=1926286 RepID=UPI0009E55556|nr:2-dehydropantoate 2-reductase [Halobacillus massiliensis]
MKIGIAGAGAVGCYFGGLLAKAGHEVTFLARGEHLRTMKADGLVIRGDTKEFDVETNFTDNPYDLSSCELLLFCVKSNDTKEMAELLKKSLQKDSLILTMQNGVENEEILQEVFSLNRLLSAVTYVQAAIEKPGVIRQQGRVKLLIGDLGDQHHSEGIVSLFQQADIETGWSENILYRKWSKLLWNATFNPLSAIAQAKVGQILEDQNLYETARQICLEAVEVAISKGFNFDKEKTINEVFFRAGYAKAHQTSMLQDRLNGKKMEVEAMCGYIVKEGKKLGISTPILQSIYSILNYINEKSFPSIQK